MEESWEGRRGGEQCFDAMDAGTAICPVLRMARGFAKRAASTTVWGCEVRAASGQIRTLRLRSQDAIRMLSGCSTPLPYQRNLRYHLHVRFCEVHSIHSAVARRLWDAAAQQSGIAAKQAHLVRPSLSCSISKQTRRCCRQSSARGSASRLRRFNRPVSQNNERTLT